MEHFKGHHFNVGDELKTVVSLGSKIKMHNSIRWTYETTWMLV